MVVCFPSGTTYEPIFTSRIRLCSSHGRILHSVMLKLRNFFLQSEETKTGDKASGYGILVAALGSIILGMMYLLPLAFTSVDIPHLLDTNNDTKGYAIAQLFYDGFKNHLGNGSLSFIRLLVPCVVFFFCGLLIVTAGSRYVFDFFVESSNPFQS